MKKKVGYILMIIIAIVGCNILYGINYGLNSSTKIRDNLYVYDIIGNKDILDIMIDGDYLYYLVSDISEGNNSNINYSFVKYDLSNEKEIASYSFISNRVLYPIKIVNKNKSLYLTSLYENVYYEFNNKLELTSYALKETRNNESYGLYNGKTFSINENKIYYNDKLYAEIPNTCGINNEILYRDNTYLRFYNYNKNLGCLYNFNNKNIYYLDYDNIDVVYGKYLEYQNDSLKFRYDNTDYYFNDITENTNLKMHNNGDYLFTYDSTNNYLRIYNLDTRRVIYEYEVKELRNTDVANLNIGDYAYFTIKKNNRQYIYVWDYLQNTRINKEMINHNEKEYRIKNDKLISDIKEKYQMEINLYDNSVKYFNDYYVIPSYDDVLINARLNTLLSLLDNFNYDIFNQISNIKKIKIYFDKSVLSKNNITTPSYFYEDDNEYQIAIDIVDDNFEKNFLQILMQLFESNMLNLYNNHKIKEIPFKLWNTYNPIGFVYSNSSSNLEEFKQDRYFFDSYSMLSEKNDRNKIFENINNQEILKYPNLLRKAIYLKEELASVYPSITISKYFINIKGNEN